VKEIKVNPDNPKKDVITATSIAIQAGKIVAFPTDTVYGLGADIKNDRALDKIFRIKKRRRDKSLIVFISDMSQLKKIVSGISAAAERLAKFFWPGALTLILPARENLPAAVTRAGTVSVRLPNSLLLREIIHQSGTFLATTSANLAGSSNPRGADAVRRELGDNIDLLLDSGFSGLGMASTVIDVTQEKIELIRPGAVSMEAIKKALEKS